MELNEVNHVWAWKMAKEPGVKDPKEICQFLNKNHLLKIDANLMISCDKKSIFIP